MLSSKIQQKYDALCAEIRHHNYRYWELNDPIISDNSYDQLVAKLEEYCIKHRDELCLREDPSKYIGVAGKSQHASPMLSLKKALQEPQVTAFITSASSELICQPKMDGVAVGIQYYSGKLSLITTRGNGILGG